MGNFQDMNVNKGLTMVGSLVLIIGLFMPIVGVTNFGNANYFENDKVGATVILFLALTSLFLVLANKNQFLWITAVGCTFAMLITFMNLQSQISSMILINPTLQWGWIVLIAGVALITLGGTLKRS